MREARHRGILKPTGRWHALFAVAAREFQIRPPCLCRCSHTWVFPDSRCTETDMDYLRVERASFVLHPRETSFIEAFAGEERRQRQRGLRSLPSLQGGCQAHEGPGLLRAPGRPSFYGLSPFILWVISKKREDIQSPGSALASPEA